MRIVFGKRFRKDFLSLEHQLRQQVSRQFAKLNRNPYVGKPLSGELARHRSLRIGKYRLIYIIRDDAIVLVAVGHRKDIYETIK